MSVEIVFPNFATSDYLIIMKSYFGSGDPICRLNKKCPLFWMQPCLTWLMKEVVRKSPGDIDRSKLSSTSTFVSHGVLIRQLLQAWYFALKRRGNRTTAPRVNVGFEISLMCPVGQQNRLIIRIWVSSRDLKIKRAIWCMKVLLGGFHLKSHK